MHIFAWIAFHSTDGNYEKLSHMATTKIDLSKAMIIQIHHKIQHSEHSPFSANLGCALVPAPIMKSTGNVRK